jgi:hypothetical protein
MKKAEENAEKKLLREQRKIEQAQARAKETAERREKKEWMLN